MSSLTLRRMSSKKRQVMHIKLRTSTLSLRLQQRYRIVAEAARGHPRLAARLTRRVTAPPIDL